MIAVIFEYRLRADADPAAYSELSRQMHALVDNDPQFGYVSEEAFTRDDGTVVAVELFETMDGMHRWRADPAHRAAQRRGRKEFYAWYRILTCTVDSEREFTAPLPQEAVARR